MEFLIKIDNGGNSWYKQYNAKRNIDNTLQTAKTTDRYKSNNENSVMNVYTNASIFADYI